MVSSGIAEKTVVPGENNWPSSSDLTNVLALGSVPRQ